jgi:hypothetical protein
VGASERAAQGAPTPASEVGTNGHPLEWLEAHLERRPGVTVFGNGELVQAVMRGKQAVYVGWNAAAGTFAWSRGERPAGEGERLAAGPARAAEQVVMLLEAPPEPWYDPAPWWRSA